MSNPYDQIKELINHPNDVINSTAREMSNLAEMLDANKLSKHEYDELCDNLLSSKEIQLDMYNLKVRQDLKAAFDVIVAAVKVISNLR